MPDYYKALARYGKKPRFRDYFLGGVYTQGDE